MKWRRRWLPAVVAVVGVKEHRTPLRPHLEMKSSVEREGVSLPLNQSMGEGMSVRMSEMVRV